MNWNKRFFLPSLFLGLLTATSFGQSPPDAQPVPEPQGVSQTQTVTQIHSAPEEGPVPRSGSALLNWSGFYIGGNVGGIWGDYGFGDSSVDVTVRQPRGLAPGIFPDGPGATVVTIEVPAFHANTGGQFIGGVQAGYNRQFGSFVFGLEGDAVGLSLSASRSFTLHSDMLNVDGLTATRSASSDWMLTGRVRLGYAWKRFLFYGTGGLAVSNMTVDAIDFASVASPGSRGASDDTLIAGWTGGGGAEFAVSDAVSISAEYRHTGFGSQDFSLSGDSRFMVHSTHTDLNEDQVTLRVNIRVDSLFHR
ncbi:MAG: outer membrane beta-barrel protein [Verrucomicrobiota bacterium]